ncbi:MAG: hypothetical protein RLZZ123_746 [Pseudomonadota bacterium]
MPCIDPKPQTLRLERPFGQGGCVRPFIHGLNGKMRPFVSPWVVTLSRAGSGLGLSFKGDDVVGLDADADPFAQFVVVVAGDMGQEGLSVAQAQGVEEF